MQNQVYKILDEMSDSLNTNQMKLLQEVLLRRLGDNNLAIENLNNQDFLELFLTAKHIEGCSNRTIAYYRLTVENLITSVKTPIRNITTEIIREYLREYQLRRYCGKVTIDNIRRNLSSFFAWLEEEDYILKSPIRRIHKVKSGTTVKEVISDENIEIMRDGCESKRDLAILDLLFSTGIRVGELVNLDISDINFEERECIVYGKGDKERRVYFDARTKLHIQNYLKERCDNNVALFVSLNSPYNRLRISGVEIRLRQLAQRLKIDRVYPHKFRRTMATRAIDKGMPIEQVQRLLGHQQIDTTMKYAMVNQNNVKTSHRKFMS